MAIFQRLIQEKRTGPPGAFSTKAKSDSDQTIACPSGPHRRTICGIFLSQLRVALKTKPSSTSIRTEIKVYAVSALLPPFGLVYVWRYYKQSDRVSQRIAAIALVLTILVTAASVYVTIDAVDSFNRMLNAALNGSRD